MRHQFYLKRCNGVNAFLNFLIFLIADFADNTDEENYEARMANEWPSLKSQSSFSSLPSVKNLFARRGVASASLSLALQQSQMASTKQTRRRLHGAAQIEPACLLPGFIHHRQTSP